ncbi:M28 family peptidase [uncultured Maribacter sp.]|uniref:M28 family peptidase n=1 Tax=uncultured Maribacter sp. TaxID=431308 RepID=UPI002626387F|nr:M28 family peptidase [uncultured Maribacter sp.]
MKKSTVLSTLILIAIAIYWSFKSSMPTYTEDTTTLKTEFSTDRALEHVEQISQKPHGVGFPEHTVVKGYIANELKKLGLEVTFQEGYTAGDWGNLSKVNNILARIKGTDSKKALLLLSHYDSHPHSSLGASDAASGVATILEGVRQFVVKEKKPKNDIIILISDSEELGLNGADLFVNKHPWIRDVGLVLNFEARGSGGPSYMLIETNKGNKKLIEEFTKANPEYPVANSLVYSIYKMLPNDTDLTIFREDGDVEGFNFAFIDDHYDYHTAKDNYERLDKNTLAHQGSYLVPLLDYFSNSDLSNLKSLSDFIYFNIPFFKLVSYPFDWIFPMLTLGIIVFILLLFQGFKKKTLQRKAILKGFFPMLISVGINGIVGYFSWTVLKTLYPQYNDILHGFTYNGHTYIAAFVLFSIGVCFLAYYKYNKITTPNLLVAPIFLWLLLCTGVSVYLKGASFFIIPVYGLLASLFVTQNQKKPNGILLVFLALPALWIFAPFIKMFPIGLGLKMMVASTLLTSLTFILLLPVFGFYKNKRFLAILSFILFIGFLFSAHLNSNFNEENAKPTSLMYLLNTNTNSAKWVTYEQQLSPWTSQYIGDTKKAPETSSKTLSSKYGTHFTFEANAPLKKIKSPLIQKTRDTIIGNQRFLDICITPQRNVNRLELITNDIEIQSAEVNGVTLSEYFLKNRKRNKLITHYITDNAYTDIRLSFPKNEKLELTFFEASNDLLSNPLFSIPERPKNNIPMPFILNDAIVTTKTLQF